MTYAKTLFSGSFFLESGRLPAEVETLAEVMQAAGFRTVGISGNGHVSEKFGLARGFDTFELVYPLARGADPATYVNRNAADIHRRALEILDDGPSDRPTFMYLHTVHPHTPYSPPHELAEELCGGIPSTIDGMSPTLLAIRGGELETSGADRRRLACLYAAGLRYADGEIGLLLDEIRGRYQPEEVLLIVTSDHGEEFFDHGGVLHGHTLYDELLRVPLIFRWPGRLAPTIVNSACDTVDLHETLRALVGAPSSSAAAGGRSLWPVIPGGDATSARTQAPFCIGSHPARWDDHGAVGAVQAGARAAEATVARGWGSGSAVLTIRNTSSTWVPIRVRPETSSAGAIPEEAGLRARLVEWIERTSQQGVSEEVELDDRTREHLEALGYLE